MIDDLKAAIVGGYDKEQIFAICDELCRKLGVNDKTELYSVIGSDIGTVYCPWDDLCEEYGFYGEHVMIADIYSLANEAGCNYHEANDALHYHAGVRLGDVCRGFYSSDQFIIVDLDELIKELK